MQTQMILTMSTLLFLPILSTTAFFFNHGHILQIAPLLCLL